MNAGYTESFNKNLQIGPEEVDEYKMYIKFICTPAEGLPT
jgi:hypothetical protein